MTPIFPGDNENPDNPENTDNPDVNPEEPTPITPVLDVILNENADDIVTDYILTIPFIVYDPEHKWNKLTLLVKTPGNDYFGVVKQLELTPDPDVEGNQNATVYYVPKDVGIYEFKVVHYVTATDENDLEIEVAVDIKDFSYEVLARDVNDSIPTEDITVNNDLLLADPSHKLVVGDTVEYEFIANHPEKITGTATLAITEPGSVVPTETRTLKFNVSKGKMRAKEVIEFAKQDEYKFELTVTGIERPTIWYVNISEKIETVDPVAPTTQDTSVNTEAESTPNENAGTEVPDERTSVVNPPEVDKPTADNAEETNPVTDPTEDFNRVTTTSVIV